MLLSTRGRVAGMTSLHCVRAVFTSLGAVEGISAADVKIGAIEVDHDERVTVDQLRVAIAVVGYELVEAETRRRGLPLADG